MSKRASAPVFRERRREQRCDVAVSAELTDMLGRAHACTVIDISGSGCRIRLKERLLLSGAVELTASDGSTTPARVVWTAGDVAGLWFASEREGGAPPTFLMSLWEQLLAGRT